MRMRFPVRRRALSTVLAAATLLTPLTARATSTTPVTPAFGPEIEDYAGYVGQSKCKPKPKPGLVAFQDLLEATYPDSTWFGISRGCDVGGRSEHKEGRALDWSRDAGDPAEQETVTAFLEWLLATDEHGNEHAMARRLGVMYVIWDRQMWSSWDQGWETFCIQKRHKCRDPETKEPVHPHDDHVHFSFAWQGARKLTSFWNPALSQPAPPGTGTPPDAR